MAARLQLISSHLVSGSNSGIVELIVESILSTGLHNATAAAIYLQSYTSNLSASTAELVLRTLAAKVHTAKEGASPKFREAYNKAVEGAQMIGGFVKEHPVYSTVIVLGILAIMCPPIIHALGFTLNGVTKVLLLINPDTPGRQRHHDLLVHVTMAALLAAIIECMVGAPQEDYLDLDEKQAIALNQASHPLDEIANDVVNTILRAEKTGAGLKAELNSIVGSYGWKEYLAEKILDKLGAALQGAHDKLGPAIRDAYHKAWTAANEIEGFVIQHPVMCSIIALGVLVVIAPWVIEALGFAELGPVEGSFAAWWQSTYEGLVPKGSLFSFFQRLGMVWLRH
ncbi:hypothetical protein E8E13_007782 [Curvularia kusanoi]|uniref:Uncharacterized protein n=1 Tax=Curvularia kusanoi TaxID=90978 RepID=A0A9P4TMI8_CURKU|nr:hypothetical protein E8E13_007782 [Curvularia kusanoi]